MRKLGLERRKLLGEIIRPILYSAASLLAMWGMLFYHHTFDRASESAVVLSVSLSFVMLAVVPSLAFSDAGARAAFIRTGVSTVSSVVPSLLCGAGIMLTLKLVLLSLSFNIIFRRAVVGLYEISSAGALILRHTARLSAMLLPFTLPHAEVFTHALANTVTALPFVLMSCALAGLLFMRVLLWSGEVAAFKYGFAFDLASVALSLCVFCLTEPVLTRILMPYIALPAALLFGAAAVIATVKIRKDRSA